MHAALFPLPLVHIAVVPAVTAEAMLLAAVKSTGVDATVVVCQQSMTVGQVALKFALINVAIRHDAHATRRRGWVGVGCGF